MQSRDVIVCRETETELVKFLEAIQKIVASEYGNKKWLGITRKSHEYFRNNKFFTCYSFRNYIKRILYLIGNTETEDQNGYCLWVKLEELPFGKHWFQVRSVKFKENEIYLQLKYLRPYQAEEKKLDVEEFMTVNLKEVCVSILIAYIKCI